MRVDRLFRDARLATMAGTGADHGLGLIEDGIVATEGGRIVYVGARADAPRLDPVETVRCEGRWITPGLVDCHTHLVYAGNRAHEFELRLNGASYEEIARAGGGIVSTVKATRAAKPRDLCDESLPRLDAADRRGRHHGRDQVGLRPRPRHRGEAAARRPLARREARRRRRHHLPRRPCAAAGSERRQGRLSRPRLSQDDPRHRPSRARRCGGRLLRGHRLLARKRPPASSPPPRSTACR
jgi:imidazolonepropionase-like amidohydrolase